MGRREGRKIVTERRFGPYQLPTLNGWSSSTTQRYPIGICEERLYVSGHQAVVNSTKSAQRDVAYKVDYISDQCVFTTRIISVTSATIVKTISNSNNDAQPCIVYK
jgi:hypothetical protein